ncbi:hypothetical protein [Phocoenobacter skyensis]|uniref:Lipoprotein n=1 Tax=Phocoenobacter skyensis TaxID=97481 RepID=A0AAJ6P0E9_9PAST|nr:hypothetical protein [Pasteurella skyensis]MDP8080218.1 hypothetical protein [Pasteurella skyensis]MDP8086243.1 hypothetical protein [Pasteurella skyensis]MDP8162834.1 hypothetical protein [Pasteurella skyensis]MDP8172579.1 hypothetical protein [Pasteurella skyensis]MDP8179079.1 hypothetical protein [Pasteurella skyensis]
MNSLKVCLISIMALGVLGCEDGNPYYQEICVDGVVYLRAYNGALTLKVDSNFYPYTCTKKEKQNG